jgi:hypothetical protein
MSFFVPAPIPPEPTTEILTAPLIGVRLMFINLDRPSLMSAFWSVPWETTEMSALCLPGGRISDLYPPQHKAPEWDCNCGLFAFASFTALRQSPYTTTRLDSNHFVVAAVVCSGKIIVHGQEGFRSQKQRIVALAKSRYTNLDLTGLLVKYDLIAVSYDELIPFASKFGNSLA